MSSLFEGVTVGPLKLANRLVMAPMTRQRAADQGVPSPLMAEYYAQRAGVGLIVTEGTQPNVVGQGYPGTPGLHTDAQVAGWRQVTDSVHAAGGQIFAQLMHSGRIGHELITGHRPVAPSPVRPAGQAYTPAGPRDFEVPAELSTDQIEQTVGAFADAARRAGGGGVDGGGRRGAPP